MRDDNIYDAEPLDDIFDLAEGADEEWDDIEEGDEEEVEEGEEVEDEVVEEAEVTPQHRTSLWWLLMSGNVLLAKGLSKYYGQMVLIAALFLLSIFVMFWSLHIDMQHSIVVREQQLLRERCARLQEIRFSRCSHSSIVEELERRNIELKDPTSPAKVME